MYIRKLPQDMNKVPEPNLSFEHYVCPAMKCRNMPALKYDLLANKKSQKSFNFLEFSQLFPRHDVTDGR